jgi:DeoR/GlpR family transcriptional regulator of sugar metabolism
MDSTKVDKSLPYTFGTLEEIDVLISDDTLPQDVRIAAQKAGVEVL